MTARPRPQPCSRTPARFSTRPRASDRAPLTWSVGWADLTAVPGGVWAWFRSGMLGESVLPRGRSLSVVVPAPAVPASAATSPVTGYGTI